MLAQELIVQNDTETDRLWAEYYKARSIEARNDLVMRYLLIPKRIVGKMAITVGSHMSSDDMMSYGILGLIDAIEKFDIARETKFETYAYMRVKGEIIDHLRNQDWAPISLRQKIKMVESAYEEIEIENRGSASEQEVAQRLNMSVEDVQKVLESSFVFNLIYIDDTLKCSGDFADTKHMEDVCEINEKKELLARFIGELSDKEKTVLNLYYMEDMTLKEIGMVLNLTESRVSQINSKILMKLRNKFKQFDY